MAGDVNLFLNDHEDRGAAEIEVSLPLTCPHLASWQIAGQSQQLVAELFVVCKPCCPGCNQLDFLVAVQVMIANPLSRRKGLAYEALILFMLYAITSLVGAHNFDYFC